MIIHSTRSPASGQLMVRRTISPSNLRLTMNIHSTRPFSSPAASPPPAPPGIPSTGRLSSFVFTWRRRPSDPERTVCIRRRGPPRPAARRSGLPRCQLLPSRRDHRPARLAGIKTYFSLVHHPRSSSFSQVTAAAVKVGVQNCPAGGFLVGAKARVCLARA